jgi:hypothetical protein
MIQPLPNTKTRKVKITCFICDENKYIHLKPWQTEKDIICPTCAKKEMVVGFF